MGLYGCPTTVNNVESIAVAPTILRRGASWFPPSAGRTMSAFAFHAVGHVNTPCVVEEAMGITFRELVEKHGGGAAAGTICLRSSPAAHPARGHSGKHHRCAMDFDGARSEIVLRHGAAIASWTSRPIS
jgi:NADH-quinone oxidoreductase subunit F